RVLALGESAEADRARLLAAYCARQLAEAARLRRDFDQAFLYADLLVAYQAPTFDLLRFQAELARDAGRLAVAAARYRRLLVAHPDALDEGIQLSRCYSTPEEARAALTELWETHRLLAVAHALATLESDQGDHEAAIGWWQEALALDPVHPILLRRVADLCRRVDRYEEACGFYRRLATATGFEPALLKTWGSTALSGDLFELAREPYERLANDHGDHAAALTLATLFARLEDYQASWDWAQKVQEQGENAEAEHLAQEAAYQLAAATADPLEAIAWRERYLAHVPEDVDAWIAQGRAQADVGHLDEAVQALSHARELAPGNTEAGWWLGQVLLQQGDRAGAREAFYSVLAEDPRHADSLFALSELAWDEGDIQTVWQLGQDLLKLDNKNPRAMELIGRCARMLAHEAIEAGDWDNAILYWELLLSFASDEQEALNNLGEAYVRAGRFAEAVGIHRELVRLSPEDPEVKFRHGEIAAMGGFWDEARQCFTELSETDPSHLPTHQALAIVALGLDEPQVAMGHYRDALAIAPEDLISLVGLGRLLMVEGEFAEAWELLKQAALLSAGEPEHAEYVSLARTCAERLAEALASKGKWAEAIRFREEIVQLVPDDPDCRRRLADAFYQAGRKAEAIGVLSALLQADPGDRQAAFLLGEIHRQSGDLEGARRIYHSILEQEPGHFDARLALAELAWDASELEPAWTHLQEALNTRPGDEAALALFRKLTLAFAERASTEGDFPAAIQWWQLAWQQDKSDVELLRRMARAQVTVGHLSGAADTYAKILDADPKDLETAHILADIHRQRGDLRSAEGPLLRIVALDPRHVPSLRALMHLARDRQNPPETLKRAYDMLDVEPQNVEALMTLAWAHEQMLERRAALEACADVIALQPQHAEAHFTMGRLARDLGDLDLAKKALTSAIYHSPKAAYYHAMGTVYQALGQQEEALASYSQALVLDPEFAEAHADLGLGLMRASQPDKAKPHLQRAFSLIPPDTERSLALQCALDLIG
ncbi:MAG TPA: tetratricopeptide repeat protein, partial [Stenomitos sp.]